MDTLLPLTVDEFDKMVAGGAFDHLNRRIELLRGELHEMNPAGPLHDDLLQFLITWSGRVVPQSIAVTSQTGLDIGQLFHGE